MQQNWIYKIYNYLDIKISKIIYTKQDSNTKEIELLNIDIKQI